MFRKSHVLHRYAVSNRPRFGNGVMLAHAVNSKIYFPILLALHKILGNIAMFLGVWICCLYREHRSCTTTNRTTHFVIKSVEKPRNWWKDGWLQFFNVIHQFLDISLKETNTSSNTQKASLQKTKKQNLTWKQTPLPLCSIGTHWTFNHAHCIF